jgi:hypothetical protein
MRFLMMSPADKKTAETPPSPELMEAIGKLMQEITQSGTLVEAGGFQTRAHLKLAGGKVRVTDGPFTEAKELIGGYVIIQVKSEAEAIELARRFLDIHREILGPSYEAESVIRQLLDPSDFGPPQG